eukprot:gene13051-14318_t
MNFLLFLGIAAFLLVTVNAVTTPVVTYQAIYSGVDFKSEGDVPNTSYYYYLGGFFNLNQTAKVYFEATIDPACAYPSSASITFYSEELPAKATYTSISPSTQEFHSSGKTLSGALDYPTYSSTSLNTRYFYAKSSSCAYHVTTYSNTK